MEKPIKECWGHNVKGTQINELPEAMKNALQDMFYVGAHSMFGIITDALHDKDDPDRAEKAADKIEHARVEINQYMKQRHGHFKNEKTD